MDEGLDIGDVVLVNGGEQVGEIVGVNGDKYSVEYFKDAVIQTKQFNKEDVLSYESDQYSDGI